MPVFTGMTEKTPLHISLTLQLPEYSQSDPLKQEDTFRGFLVNYPHADQGR
jgi:hypothetical protein